MLAEPFLFSSLLLFGQIMRLWYLVPLVLSFSLVYGATRHERMLPILEHAARFAFWVLSFLGILYFVLWLISR